MEEFKTGNTTFQIHAGKSVYMPERKTLLVSDLHVGKSAHFRKNGMSLPSDVFFNDLERLQLQLNYFKPERLLILGDLFHSKENHEFYLWEHFLKKFPNLIIELVPGNHDAMHKEVEQYGIHKLHEEQLEEDGILFSHDKTEETELLNIYGHVHPGVRLKGQGNQILKLPALIVNEKEIVLPAFCGFSGLFILKPSRQDLVYVYLEDDVLKVS